MKGQHNILSICSNRSYFFIISSHTRKSHWHREEDSWVVFGWYWVQSLEIPELKWKWSNDLSSFFQLSSSYLESVGGLLDHLCRLPESARGLLFSFCCDNLRQSFSLIFSSESAKLNSFWPLPSLLWQLLLQWPLLSGGGLVTSHLFWRLKC